MNKTRLKILMVCLGNICRSPLAHGIMERMGKEEDYPWEVDSAGTSGFHNGNEPDERSIQVAHKFGLDISHQTSRKFVREDFKLYDYIFAMDKSNLADILSLATTEEQKAKVHLFLDFAGEMDVDEVPDPYYEGGFEYVYQLIEAACKKIALKIKH